MRRLAALFAVILAPTLAALACNHTKTVAVPDDDDDDDATTKPDAAGTSDDDDAAPPIDLGDAGFAIPECTGAVISSLTNVIRLRVHPDGSLFALTEAGVLTKYAVGGDASTDCTLTVDPTFAADTGLHDFDIAGNDIFTIRAPSLNSATVEKRDPTTGATTGVTCNLGGDSNAYWGRLAVSPDGLHGAVVSTGTSGANTGSGVYAYSLAFSNTCTATAWAPNVGTLCNPSGTPGILAQGLRATATDVYIVCSQVVSFQQATTPPKVTTSGFTPTHLEDLALGSTTLDAPDDGNTQILRFDAAAGTFQKAFSVRSLIGNAIPGTEADLYRVHALTDVVNGQRYIAVTSDGVDANHIFRIADF